MNYLRETAFHAIWQKLNQLLTHASEVTVGEWQGQTNPTFSETIELTNVSFQMFVPNNKEGLQRLVKPNLPWAEDHFQERVSGIPHNPPPSHTYWPYAQSDNKEHTDGQGHFSHTYPERMWPKRAAPGTLFVPRGIRYNYGDLRDLVFLLQSRPNTRQAFLPIWFPEDLNASMYGQRVPCTLGYHFLRRQGNLQITYYMRSCDLFRYFRDDVYMAARLLQWVAEQIPDTLVGHLNMHIVSLHIFREERERARIQYTEADALNALNQGGWW